MPSIARIAYNAIPELSDTSLAAQKSLLAELVTSSSDIAKNLNRSSFQIVKKLKFGDTVVTYYFYGDSK